MVPVPLMVPSLVSGPPSCRLLATWMVPSLSTVPAVVALLLVWTVEPAGIVLVAPLEPKVP